MRRPTSILATLLILTGSLAFAQDEPSARYERETGRREPAEMLDFEVVSIDSQQMIVVARDLESRDEFRFRLPAQSFRGQRFTADLGSAGRGQRIEVRGNRDAKLEQLVLEAPLGLTDSTGESRRLRRPDYTPRPPSGPGYASGPPSGPPGEPPADSYRPRDLRPKGSGPIEYRVESFDAQSWVVTARGSDDSTVRLKVDPEAFVGYRFQAPVRNMRQGQGFTLLALNQGPIENCCTLLSDGDR